MTRRLFTTLLLAVVPVVMFTGAFLERDSSAAAIVARPHGSTQKIDPDLALSAELDGVRLDLRQRIELKDSLIAELVAGRTTLADVTSQFLVLNESQPTYMEVIRLQFRGATDRERIARNVIAYAAIELGRSKLMERMLVVARLEYELQQVIAQETR